MPSFPKPDPGLVERVDAILSTYPARRRPMFGTTSWFLESNEQMFAGVWGDGLTARVGAEEALRLARSGEVEAFDPMGGRPMKEYVLVPADRIEEDADLEAWVGRAARFADGLPPKRRSSDPA